MPPALSEIQTAWAAEFPGTSLLIVILRTALALADWRARQIQFNFQQIHEDLRLTGLPMQFWDTCTRQTYQFMERANARSQREFRQSLRALQASYKKPDPPKPPPPEPPPPPKMTFFQTVLITVEEDGTVKTSIEPPADFMCAIAPEPLEIIGWFARQYHFESRIVPECYRHLLTHEGVTYEPKLGLLVSYRKEDFLRLCRQEIETSSPIPIDEPASRSLYQWTS
jgi:hypothetical protein